MIPTELGFTVNDFLVEKLPSLFDIGFTAQMEQKLDDVENGSLNWVELMTDFYASFSKWVEDAKNSGAPPAEKAQEILAIFDRITFAEPQKVGSRKFDDGKFVQSVRDKYEKSSKLSEKQYQALVVLAAKYADQLDKNSLSDELQAALAAALDAEAEKQEKLKQRPPAPADGGYAPVFAAFANVEFPAPRASGKRTGFDEGKFFKSLKKQSESGSPLSEKQLAALKRMVVKYQSQLIEPEKICQLLQIEPAPEAPAEAAGTQEDTAGLLAKLGEVKEWATPEKKGRFVFDDRKFFQSLDKQYKEKKSLSDKQLAALKKLADKYLNS